MIHTKKKRLPQTRFNRGNALCIPKALQWIVNILCSFFMCILSWWQLAISSVHSWFSLIIEILSFGCLRTRCDPQHYPFEHGEFSVPILVRIIWLCNLNIGPIQSCADTEFTFQNALSMRSSCSVNSLISLLGSFMISGALVLTALLVKISTSPNSIPNCFVLNLILFHTCCFLLIPGIFLLRYPIFSAKTLVINMTKSPTANTTGWDPLVLYIYLYQKIHHSRSWRIKTSMEYSSFESQ